MRPLSALVIVLAALSSRDARSSTPPGVQWRSTGLCPEPKNLLRRVAASIGLQRDRLGERLRRVETSMTRRHDGRLRVRLVVVTAAHAGERSFDAATCADAIEGSLFVVGLALDPRRATVASSPPGLSASPDVSPTYRMRVPVQVLVNMDLGIVPHAGLSVGLGVGAAWERFRLELDAAHGLPRRAAEDADAERVDAELRLMLRASLRGCYVPWHHRVEVGGCLGGDLGWLRGKGLNIQDTSSGDALWIGIHGGVTIGYRLWRWLGLRLQGHLGVAPRRPSFEIEGIGEVHQASRLFGRLTAGLETWLR